jgi:hypothetical protein
MADTGNEAKLELPAAVIKAIREEAIVQVGKWTVGAFVLLFGIAASGWWLYLQKQLDEYIVVKAGGIPANAVIAVDEAGGCSKLGNGWEDAGFGGRVLVGAIGGDARWGYRVVGGRSSITIESKNIPPLFLGFHTNLSGNDSTLSMIEALSFTKPKSPVVAQTSTEPASAIDIMPPYVPLFFCKKIK